MVKTRAEQLFEYQQTKTAQVSPNIAKNVSQYRRESLEHELDSGNIRESSTFIPISAEQQLKSLSHKLRGGGDSDGLTVAGVLRGSGNGALLKAAQSAAGAPISGSGAGMGGAGGAGGVGFRGPGGTSRQVPEVYSPLWLNSNLNLPRDRATINAWSRSFFSLNPIVHNSITLHSTYPIAKLNIKCRNAKVEKFFAAMVEELDLMTVCSQIAQEFWILGEAFIYAELDQNTAKWSRLLIQNPDYITVKRSAVAGEPIISMRPDENLRRIVFSQRPSDIQQRMQLDPAIVEHVKRGENIPLNNFYVSHLARKIAPYEIRGTGLIVSCFRQLMLFDKFRECYSADTEILTNSGFKRIDELCELTDKLNINPEYMNGAEYDENGNIKILTLKDDVKVACYNNKNGQLEYHKPEACTIAQYNGKMINFAGKKVDVLVTPNHKMFVKENTNGSWSNFEPQRAEDILKKKKCYKFKSTVDWKGKSIESVNVIGKDVPIELYLKVLGYIISEGCVYQNYENNRYDNKLVVNQLTSSDCYDDMSESLNKFAEIIDKKAYSSIAVRGGGFSENTPKERWDWWIHSKDLINYFMNEIGNGETAKSRDKKVPRWIMELEPRLLKVLLDSLVAGDGSDKKSKYGTDSIGYSYSTVSKQLADDVYEIAFKLGFAPNMHVCKEKTFEDGRSLIEYRVLWSTTNYGREPNVFTGEKKTFGNGGGATAKEVDYNGPVWCFTVPTGLFVTRRNGKITIQGNSKYAQADNMVNPLTLVKVGNEEFRPTPTDLEAWRNVFAEAQYDKDFKIFTHNAVTVERVGWAQGIYDISGDITQLIKEIYIGLMVPSVIMDGSDTTYATGSVALDVLRQRYMQFRNMLTAWLKRKIFAPISKLNDFYEYVDGEKVLIVPEIDWNHMSLFDMSDYIQNVSTLASGEGAAKKLSLQTLYRSLGVDYEDEQRKMRYEDIRDAIRTKELQSLQSYSLNELRSLTPNDEIKEVEQPPTPGETPYDEAPVPGEDGGGGGLLGLPPRPGGGLPPAPVGRPPGIAPQPPGGGTGIGIGGLPRPPTPS